MNILFITPSIPSRLHRIRAFEMIRALSKNHKVHLVSLSSRNNELPKEIIDSVSSYSIVHQPLWRSLLYCLLFLPTRIPLEVAYCRSQRLVDTVRKITEENKIDLVYIKRLRIADSVAGIDKTFQVVLDTTDAMSLFYLRASHNASLFRKLFFWLEYKKYLSYEKRVSKKIKKWICCSKVDAEYLKSKLLNIDIEVIPNLVDIDYFNPDLVDERKIEKHSILFSGLMDKFVNIEGVKFLMEEIYPKLIVKYPDLKIYLVGPNPVASVRKYQSKNVIVTGYVDDIRDYVSRAEIVVCPIRTGTGMRNKIMQAWAMGKPVVSTSIGFEGLFGGDGKEILIADDADTFVSKIKDLLDNPTLRKKIGSSARDLIVQKYSELSTSTYFS